LNLRIAHNLIKKENEEFLKHMLRLRPSIFFRVGGGILARERGKSLPL
jgi:hypothetical protein